MPSRRPIAKRLGARGLDGRRDVARIVSARAATDLITTVVSPCIYFIQDGAVEPENLVRDVTTSFSRSRAAIPLLPHPLARDGRKGTPCRPQSKTFPARQPTG